jgi:hypothetical protein
MAKTRSRSIQAQRARQKTVNEQAVRAKTEEAPAAIKANEQVTQVKAEETTIQAAIKASGQAVVEVASPVASPRTEQALQTREERGVSTPIRFPNWPTSKPGPRVTPPPPGMRTINALRPEQMVEVGYNQETGEPGIDSPLRTLPNAELVGDTSFDQPRIAQEEIGKRKKRL